jgi:hypothetical protein
MCTVIQLHEAVKRGCSNCQIPRTMAKAEGYDVCPLYEDPTIGDDEELIAIKKDRIDQQVAFGFCFEHYFFGEDRSKHGAENDALDDVLFV